VVRQTARRHASVAIPRCASAPREAGPCSQLRPQLRRAAQRLRTQQPGALTYPADSSRYHETAGSLLRAPSPTEPATVNRGWMKGHATPHHIDLTPTRFTTIPFFPSFASRRPRKLFCSSRYALQMTFTTTSSNSRQLKPMFSSDFIVLTGGMLPISRRVACSMFRQAFIENIFFRRG